MGRMYLWALNAESGKAYVSEVPEDYSAEDCEAYLVKKHKSMDAIEWMLSSSGEAVWTYGLHAVRAKKDIRLNGVKGKKDRFDCVIASREDLDAIKGSKSLTDSEMSWIARKVGEGLVENGGYWELMQKYALYCIAEKRKNRIQGYVKKLRESSRNEMKP
jgi:hypothetical protein